MSLSSWYKTYTRKQRSHCWFKTFLEAKMLLLVQDLPGSKDVTAGSRPIPGSKDVTAGSQDLPGSKDVTAGSRPIPGSKDVVEQLVQDIYEEAIMSLSSWYKTYTGKHRCHCLFKTYLEAKMSLPVQDLGIPGSKDVNAGSKPTWKQRCHCWFKTYTWKQRCH